MDAASRPVEPLRQRLPGYLVAFAAGLGAGTLVGVLIWLATSARLIDAVGYSYSGLGAVLLVVGGARGGGYLSPGSGGAEPRDPVERRRARLRARPDPASFWQVVAGFAYVGVGIVLTVAFAAGRG